MLTWNHNNDCSLEQEECANNIANVSLEEETRTFLNERLMCLWITKLDSKT